MRFIFILLLSTSSSLTSAETTLSGSDFDAFTNGHRLYYCQNGRVYGAESYFDNARVRWSFLDGNCLIGRWYEASELICFDYSTVVDVQCWHFFKGDNGLIAKFDGDTDSQTLYEAYRAPSLLKRPGPISGSKTDFPDQRVHQLWFWGLDVACQPVQVVRHEIRFPKHPQILLL